MLVSIVLAELVDQLISDQTTARREGPKPVSRPRLLHATRLTRGGQRLPRQIGKHLPNRLSFVPSPFLRGAEYIIVNVKRSAHASDATASRSRSHLVERANRTGPSPVTAAIIAAEYQ